MKHPSLPIADCRLPIALALLIAFTLSIGAADKSWLDGINVSAVGAYQQAGLTHGPSEYGAGVDLGLPINKFVSIHCRNLSWEGPDKSWGGSVVDETSIYARADFVSFAAEKFRLFGTGGGTRHWNLDDWSFGVGLGAEYRFSKHIAMSAAEEVDALIKNDKRWRTILNVTFTF
jgi:hypothetical protein